MTAHHTSQHLHANLADTDTRDCCLEQPHRGYAPKKRDEIFENLPNLFGIADDILNVGYDLMVKTMMPLQKVLQICRQVNLKVNKDKCHFRCT